ncbi:hypothetical protein COCVIDRAFT_21058 [Bipolaris victoriae FI3]|uniref:Fungal N-terminal domain-containing protein n=1 Tax=Bipolaris victoriae (strain FI3) TaxID=930091 RepID=W7DRT8_BIPV3|nr:hypothetical protein COCVIDRAFT_21058 [Bipolaris victoriae FI3]
MAAKTDHTVCCGDSGLSVAANVIGILTFVLGAALTYFAYFILSVNALEDLRTIYEDQERWRIELQPIINHCEQEYHRNDPTFSKYCQQLKATLEQSNRVTNAITRELEKLPKFDNESRIPHAFQIRRRVIWVFRRQKIIGYLDQLFRIKTDVYSIFMSYLIQ